MFLTVGIAQQRDDLHGSAKARDMVGSRNDAACEALSPPELGGNNILL